MYVNGYAKVVFSAV